MLPNVLVNMCLYNLDLFKEYLNPSKVMCIILEDILRELQYDIHNYVFTGV